jgi:hypothetical protein
MDILRAEGHSVDRGGIQCILKPDRYIIPLDLRVFVYKDAFGTTMSLLNRAYAHV